VKVSQPTARPAGAGRPRPPCYRPPVRSPLLCLLLVAAAATPAAAADPPLWFRGVRIFDGRAVQQGDVLVEGGLIRSVGPLSGEHQAALRAALPPRAPQVIEGKGKTLLPGLIDARAHAGSERARRQALAFGVTTEVDVAPAPPPGDREGWADVRGLPASPPVTELLLSSLEAAPEGRIRDLAREHALVASGLTVAHAGCAAGAGGTLPDGFSPFLDEGEVARLARAGRERPPASLCAWLPTAVLPLVRGGVTLLAGSDAGAVAVVVHGASLHQELALLVAAGLTPIEALTAATAAPASRLGLRDRGRIARGLRADLLLVEGDPTTDILRTRDIVSVFRAGAPVDRAAFAAEVARSRADADRATSPERHR